MKIQNQVISIIESALETKVTGISLNYVKEHDFKEVEPPKDMRDVKIIPVFTVETENPETEKSPEKEELLQKGMSALNRNILLIMKEKPKTQAR